MLLLLLSGGVTAPHVTADTPLDVMVVVPHLGERAGRSWRDARSTPFRWTFEPYVHVPLLDEVCRRRRKAGARRKGQGQSHFRTTYFVSQFCLSDNPHRTSPDRTGWTRGRPPVSRDEFLLEFQRNAADLLVEHALGHVNDGGSSLHWVETLGVDIGDAVAFTVRIGHLGAVR
jgi:hypothetical protein